MNCSVCGQRVPEGAIVCPQCGNLVSNSNTQTSISSNNPTVAPSAYYQSGPPVYGADPYSAPPIPPTAMATPSSPGYQPYHTPHTPFPYGTTEQIPPPPPDVYMPPAGPPTPRKKRGGLVIGLIALIVLVFGGGGFLLLANRPPSGPTQAQLNATATALSAQKAAATATAVQVAATRNPYPPNTGTLVLNDPLHDNSKGYKWDEATMYDNNGKGSTAVCGFRSGAYHVSRQLGGALLCDPEAPGLMFSNLTFEANLTLLKGDYPGIAFRINQAQGTGYLLDIDMQGNYGIFLMNLNAKNSQDEYKRLHGGANAAIKKGLNQSNLLAIVANGPTLSIYINNQYIDSVQDSTYKSGQIGLYVYGSNTCDLMATGARAWKL